MVYVAGITGTMKYISDMDYVFANKYKLYDLILYILYYSWLLTNTKWYQFLVLVQLKVRKL